MTRKTVLMTIVTMAYCISTTAWCIDKATEYKLYGGAGATLTAVWTGAYMFPSQKKVISSINALRQAMPECAKHPILEHTKVCNQAQHTVNKLLTQTLLAMNKSRTPLVLQQDLTRVVADATRTYSETIRTDNDFRTITHNTAQKLSFITRELSSWPIRMHQAKTGIVRILPVCGKTFVVAWCGLMGLYGSRDQNSVAHQS